MTKAAPLKLIHKSNRFVTNVLTEIDHLLWLSLLCSRDLSDESLRFIRDKIPRDDHSWGKLLAYASENKLVTSIYPKLTELKLSDEIDPDVISITQNIHLANEVRNNLFIKQTVEVIDRLHSDGIQVTLLKGIAELAKGIYPTLGFRYLSDVDLLVEPNDIKRSAEILKAFGMESIEVPFDRESLHHPYICFRKDFPGRFELHQTMPGFLSFPIDSKWLYKTEKIVFNGKELQVMSPTAHLATTIVHMKLHHHGLLLNSIQPRFLNNLSYLVNEDEIDWALLQNLFQFMGLPSLIEELSEHLNLFTGTVLPNSRYKGLTNGDWRRRIKVAHLVFLEKYCHSIENLILLRDRFKRSKRNYPFLWELTKRGKYLLRLLFVRIINRLKSNQKL